MFLFFSFALYAAFIDRAAANPSRRSTRPGADGAASRRASNIACRRTINVRRHAHARIYELTDKIYMYSTYLYGRENQRTKSVIAILCFIRVRCRPHFTPPLQIPRRPRPRRHSHPRPRPRPEAAYRALLRPEKSRALRSVRRLLRHRDGTDRALRSLPPSAPGARAHIGGGRRRRRRRQTARPSGSCRGQCGGGGGDVGGGWIGVLPPLRRGVWERRRSVGGACGAVQGGGGGGGGLDVGVAAVRHRMRTGWHG